MKITLAALALTLIGLSACQKKDEKFSYNLTENGCSTNTQEFSSKNEMCAGLRDDRRNNYCALSLRREKYHAECGGDF